MSRVAPGVPLSTARPRSEHHSAGPMAILVDDDSQSQGNSAGGPISPDPADVSPPGPTASARPAPSGAEAADGAATGGLATPQAERPDVTADPAAVTTNLNLLDDDPESEPQEDAPSVRLGSGDLFSPQISVRRTKSGDENMALSMAEYQKHIALGTKWNWTTQETFAAVEAVLCVKDLGTEDGATLAYKCNIEYAKQVNSVSDTDWECGGRPGKAASIKIRIGSTDGKGVETSVKARFETVMKMVLNRILPLWKKALPDGKIPSGKNLDDIIKLVRDEYFTRLKSESKVEATRQDASKGAPEGWTNAFFEAFLKYSAPAEKNAVETFNPSTRPEKRSGTNDGKPGSSQMGRAEHRESIRANKRKGREVKLEITTELLARRLRDKEDADDAGKAIVQNKLDMTAVRQKQADALEREAFTNTNKFSLEAATARIARAKALWDFHEQQGSDAVTLQAAKDNYRKALEAEVVYATPTKSARRGAPSAAETEDGASSPSAVPGTTEVHVNVDA